MAGKNEHADEASDALVTDEAEFEFEGRDRLLDGFQFAAWALFFTWRAGLLLLPISPLYVAGDDGWSAVAVVVVLVLPPLAVCIASDRLANVRALTALPVISVVLFAVAFVLEAFGAPPIVPVAFISVALCGMQAGWLPYDMRNQSYRAIAVRCVVTAAVFAALAFAPEIISPLVFRILPFASLALMLVYLTGGNSVKMRFCLRADSIKRTNLLTENPFWLIGGPLVVGVGVGCILGSGVPAQTAILCVVATMLVSAAFHAVAWHRHAGRVSGSIVLAMEAAAIVPLCFLAPITQGPTLAALGAALVFLGRTQNIVNAHDDFEEAPVGQDYVDLFFYGWRTSVEMLGTVGAALATSLVLKAVYQIDVKMLYFVVVLEVVIVIIVAYLAAIILWRSQGQNMWLRKVEMVQKRYGLTPRQCDVFKLLSYGRNAEYISRQLVISQTTAKSHIYAIYKKLRVHTQQELIDLVDQARPKD